jgi:hypothetical protein
LCYQSNADDLAGLVDNGILVFIYRLFHADKLEGPVRYGLLTKGFIDVIIDNIAKQSFALDVLSALAKYSEINHDLSFQALLQRLSR